MSVDLPQVRWQQQLTDLCCSRPNVQFIANIQFTMKFAVVSSLIASAAAFAPVQNARQSTALKAFESEPGVLQPTGYFDPLGLSKNISQEKFDQFRAAELKHGRVAQLAVLGYVAPETYKWGGEIAFGTKFADIPNGLAAIEAVPFLGWVQMIAAVGYVEYTGEYGNFEIGKVGESMDPETLFKRQTQELQHGRLAMLAIAELVRHDLSDPDHLDHLITGLPFIYK